MLFNTVGISASPGFILLALFKFPFLTDQSRQAQLQVVEWSYSVCKGKIMSRTKAL